MMRTHGSSIIQFAGTVACEISEYIVHPSGSSVELVKQTQIVDQV
eukprot:COSAG02_NODE_217_length_28595_cov_19.642371_26_plen_45_part_00